MSVTNTHTLIIGAGPSGLSCAAALQKRGIGYMLIEKADRVGSSWHHHYDRLHLHTNKKRSALPYRPFGKRLPRYPDKQQVIDYLDGYKNHFHINVLLNTSAIDAKRAGDGWTVETNHGSFSSKYLIMATGAFGQPKTADLPGMQSFPGKILHSAGYKTGKDFSGARVLVIGFGNSACEIAMDLFEQGAMPALSVRSPVNVVPRDVFGIPIIELSLLMNRLSPRLADAISAPLLNRITGDLSKLGLEKMPYGPLEQIRRDGKAPVLDIGTLKYIRKGYISIFPGISSIEGNRVCFTDGSVSAFDAIIAATGYEPGDIDIVKAGEERLADLKFSTARQKYFGGDGLYFCGYWISPTGQLREIALDAKRIAKHIAVKECQQKRSGRN